MNRLALFGLFALLPLLARGDTLPAASNFFGIQVVDDQTGRGVPMVELKTTTAVSYYTDSDGCIAFYEPGLMDKKVWFGVSSPGYEFPADGFGERGVKLTTHPGDFAVVKIKRINIAERLYRVTGEGIYRDTILLGRKPPINLPMINAEVAGQDGVLNAIYRGKLYWFYGDTARLSYNLGNYSMTGATTSLPSDIDPAKGFQLHYFTEPDGFVRPMAPIPGEGVVWLSGLVVLPDPEGHERMLAHYDRRKGLGDVLENGFVVFNDQTQQFEKLKELPLKPGMMPRGYPFRVTENGVEYIYFTGPYPSERVKADWNSYLDLSQYECFTCLDGKSPLRDANGKLVWRWKTNTHPFRSQDQDNLIRAGKMRRAESPFRLQDADTGRPIALNNCSCCWNEFRHRYLMIASESMGATVLGEVWYSEAEKPEGPWIAARKIITHVDKTDGPHDFYNPVQHPFFDQEGGRVIYLEGSYVNTFSGNPRTTPYYEYNQIMYRLDLSDPRLKLP